eukprot:CAMPEP_0171302312 /NCGR_PEP_ID=MMETSP0816-20121228/11689_1 /TAXON_ID=420281 /ORGANISM="Proboscia inermis, Strain CCAP1064/1" /LENGTH=30 /DNA_ID= /DNA_START= /DNA_END= /DNA_ORIENTATION=
MAAVNARSPKVSSGHPNTNAIPGGVQVGMR